MPLTLDVVATTTWTGLAARSWDALGGDDPQDDYEPLLALLRARSGRSLDVGCGTGRLLLRLLREGLDVEGVDPSRDMLEICRAKAVAEGLEPVLHRRGMEDLGDAGPYRTIVVPCGSFMLLVDDDQALAALRSMRDRLTDDGLLWFNVFGPSQPPRPTIGVWGRRAEGVLPDGSTVVMDVVTDEYDEQRHVVRSRRRYTRMRDGVLVEDGELDDVYRWSAPERVLRLLVEAGFARTRTFGGYGGEPLGDGSPVGIFVAER